MVGIDKSILNAVCLKHTDELKKIIICEIQVVNLCIKYLDRYSSEQRKSFKTDLHLLSGEENIKKRSINWFLKSQKTEKGEKTITAIRSLNKLDNFFKPENRVDGINNHVKTEIQRINRYFSDEMVSDLLSEKPTRLEQLQSDFFNQFPQSTRKTVNKHIARYLEFLFDYSEFSSKKSTFLWRAYLLTRELGINSCLYCNRNYILTVSNSGKDIIRPELDHFLPKSINPILSLSFYNLVPSCHTCNSNLKGQVDFKLNTHFHPYLSDFTNENIFFTYLPTNAKAFYGDKRGLKIKLDTSISNTLLTQITSNITLFKLDEIYNEHIDIVEGMLEIQKKANKQNIKSIFEKILVDSAGEEQFTSEEELYELMIRNYYNNKDFYKKPMAKFERDMAWEIGLLKCTN